MRPHHLALAVAAALAAPRASAQVSNHGIAVESGISAPLAAPGSPSALFAVTASAWLQGDLDGFARLAYASAGGTGDRAAVPALAGTVGLRLSLGGALVRPQLFAEAGWARLERAARRPDRATFGVGGALAAFPVLDLSVSVRAALRMTPGAATLEAALCAAGYF